MAQESYSHAPVPTGIRREVIDHVGRVLTTVPDGFHLHPTLAKRFVPRRLEALQNDGPIDWACAESLAWGALLLEGNPVRLSGRTAVAAPSRSGTRSSTIRRAGSATSRSSI